jgi:hypothetical protein
MPNQIPPSLSKLLSMKEDVSTETPERSPSQLTEKDPNIRLPQEDLAEEARRLARILLDHFGG